MSALLTHRAPWIPLLAVACLHAVSLPARAQTLQLDIDGVPQAGAQLCWAAVSEMVINHMTSTTSKVSQGQLAAYNKLGLQTLPQIKQMQDDPMKAPTLMDKLADCTPRPNECNQTSHDPLRPLLLGLTSDTAHSPLPPNVLTEQIQAGKPVAISWHFVDPDLPDDFGFTHQLIVVGVDNGGEHVLIWDPWPYDSDTASVDPSHYRWLEHVDYKNPSTAMGATVTHLVDIFDLERDGSPPVALVHGGTPPPFTPPPPPPPPPTPAPPQLSHAVAMQSESQSRSSSARAPIAAPVQAVTFADAIKSTEKLSGSARALKPKPKIQGRASEVGPRTADRPLPIVVLTPANLLAQRLDLEKLLQPVTRAVLYPVLADGKVVDSYLATIGPEGWVERGYASTEVTRRLVEQRRVIGGDSDAFYVVAIPAWATFFLAEGVGNSTRLTPIATTTFSQAGRTASASAILPAIANDIRKSMDQTRDADRVRTPSRQN